VLFLNRCALPEDLPMSSDIPRVFDDCILNDAVRSGTKQSRCISRRLKIEAAGDSWKGDIKPKIRLVGRWLEQAGFKPGSHVQVSSSVLGVLELRSSESLSYTQPQILPQQTELAF
jgi:hypothetical protein